MNAIINERNKQRIRQSVKYGLMQGRSMKALYMLIQKKGEPITTTHEKLRDAKALEISEGEWVSIVHTPIRSGLFYPCRIDMYLLTKI